MTFLRDPQRVESKDTQISFNVNYLNLEHSSLILRNLTSISFNQNVQNFVCFQEAIPVYNSQTTIENLTKELEHSLDIELVSKGEYVVKPQVVRKITYHITFCDM